MKQFPVLFILASLASATAALTVSANVRESYVSQVYEDEEDFDWADTFDEEFIAQEEMDIADEEEVQPSFWMSSIADADQYASGPKPKSAAGANRIKEYTSRLQVGANYTHVYLKPEERTSFDGNLGGLQGLYEYWASSHFYAAAKLAWRQGNMDGSSGERSLVYIDTQERLGYALTWEKPDLVWSIYSGFGFRYLGHEFKPDHGSSVTLNYSEFYVPVGWTAEFTINSWFALDVNFTWMPQVFPTVWIDPLRGASWSLKKKFANFLVEMPLDFTPTKNKKYHLIVTPFYEYWQDGRSTAKTTSGVRLGIPENTYQFFGFDVNFGYCF
ncbi:MAG: hypothetical protein JSR39_03815 [Verrucomicrobia bacterium]|nr:hypothetical protein [Verrucomicrobiota bacterium]